MSHVSVDKAQLKGQYVMNSSKQFIFSKDIESTHSKNKA